MAGVLALLVPGLFALYLEASNGAVHLLPDGDEAVVETRLLTLQYALPLVGPYSRFGWNHPGPFFWYSLAGPYLLSGARSVALAITAAVFNLAALVAIVALLRRELTGTIERWAALLFLAVFVHYFAAVFLPTAYTTVWNPVITLLPYGVLLLLCAGLAIGRVQYWPAAVVLHAYTTQSHVGYVPSTTLALALAVGLGVYARHKGLAPAQPRRAWPWWTAGVVAFVVLWMPPAIDELSGSHNLVAIATFFSKKRSVFVVDDWMAVRLVAWRATAPWRALRGDANPDRPCTAGVATLLWLLVTVVALAFGWWRARRDQRRYAAALCAILILEIAVAVLSMLRIDTPEQPYLTWWVAVVGSWSWIAISAALLPSRLDPQLARWAPSLPRAGDRTAIGLAAVALFGVAALSWRSVSWLGTEYRRFAADVARDRGPTVDLARRLVPLFDCGEDVGLVIATHDLWGTVAGVLLDLDKAHLRPILEPPWRVMFGPGYRYEDDPPAKLVFADKLVHDARLLLRAPRYYVYGVDAERPMASPAGPAPRVVDSTGAHGELDRLVDGTTPVEGAPWNSEGTVSLESPTSWVTFAFPSRDLLELAVNADGNDAYWIQGSTDGWNFVPVGQVPRADRFGMRTRHIVFSHPRPFSYLRIGPKDGDSLYSLRQVTPTFGAWGMQHFEADEAPAEGEDGASGGARDGEAPQPPEPGSPPTTWTFALPEVPLEGFTLTTDGGAPYRVYGSMDGRTRHLLGTIPAAGAPGPQSRSFYFNDRELRRTITLTSRAPGRPSSVIDVRPVVTAGSLVDLTSSTADGASREGWSGREHDDVASRVWAVGPTATLPIDLPHGPGSELLVSAESSPTVPEGQRLTVDLGGHAVAEFALTPEVHTFHASLPPLPADARGPLVLHFAQAVAPSRVGPSRDERPLAASIYRVAIRPAQRTLHACEQPAASAEASKP
jgi:hypothetical protein